MITINRNKVLSFSLVATVLATDVMGQATVAADADEGFRLVRGELGVVHAASYPRPAETRFIDTDAGSTNGGFRFGGHELGWVHAPDQGPEVSFAPDVTDADSGFHYVGGELGWIYDANRAR